MTVREVAKRLEVSTSLAYRLIESGKLPCSRHGLGRGVIRVSEEQLAEYLAGAERRESAPPEPAPVPPRQRLKHLRL